MKQGILGSKLLVLAEQCQPDYLAQNERFRLAENLRSARCSASVLSKVLVARKTDLITARVRKNKRIAPMLANAFKADHSIPLWLIYHNG